MIRRAFVSLVVSLSTGAAVAAPMPGTAIRESAETLYRYAGLERQIPQLGDQIARQVQSDSSAIPATSRERIAGAAREAFGAERMKSEILADLRMKWNPTLAGDALKWLRSPVGRQVIQMEEAASTPEAQRALESFAASLSSKPPDPKRLESAKQLDQATRATDISVEIMSTMALAIARGAAAVNPGLTSPEDFESAIAAQRPAMAQAAEVYTLTSFLYTYRDLSPQHFAEYLAFLDSPAGRWYQKSVGEAFQGSIEKASERFATEVMTNMPSDAPH